MARKTDPLLTLPDKGGVLYVRLYQRMRALILEGSWPSGMRLPSTRRLAEDLGISRNTASLAVEQLLADGWVEARSRAGVFVASPLGQAAEAHSESQPLRIGNPPVPFELAQGAIDAFPIDRWAKLQAKIWSRAVPDLLYESDMMGDAGLRRAITNVVAPSRGLTVSPEHLLIVTSTQAAMDLVAAVLPPRSEIVVEDPGYIFADAAFTRRGHRIIPAPVDDEGMNIAAARSLAADPALILVTPCSHFPTGRPMSGQRRADLLAWARDTDAWIMEDDYDANIRFDGQWPTPPVKSDDPDDRVILVSSFNRLLFCSLRLGFMAVPARLMKAVLRARQAVDQFVNLPNQLVLRAFIEEGGYAAHLRSCRELYHRRRQALLAALEPYYGTVLDPIFNPCGLYVVLRPLHVSAGQLAARLADAGIACMTVSDFARHQRKQDGVLLGFAAFSDDVIEAMRPAINQALSPLLCGVPAVQRASGR